MGGPRLRMVGGRRRIARCGRGKGGKKKQDYTPLFFLACFLAIVDVFFDDFGANCSVPGFLLFSYSVVLLFCDSVSFAFRQVHRRYGPVFRYIIYTLYYSPSPPRSSYDHGSHRLSKILSEEPRQEVPMDSHCLTVDISQGVIE